VDLRALRKHRITPRRVVAQVVWWVAVCFIAMLTVVPLVWTVGTSFKPANEILGNTLGIIPNNPTIGNYVKLFASFPFARYIFNTLVVTIGGILTNLIFGSAAGYALAKLKFRGRHSIFTAYLASMMIPGIVTMIPTFLVLRHAPLVGGNDIFGNGGTGFINSYWAIILPGGVGALAVFMMRQFFLTLPDELGEAARVDGANEFQIFWKIYLPLVKPGLAVLGILTFQGGWNNFMWPLIVLNDPAKMTVQVGLAGFTDDTFGTQYGPLMAGTVLTMLPVLLVFLLCQKWIIQGIATTGGK
ncbi:MAG: carbohydrate ABC transporter permease, partial [Bifidobacteriaceae bacterium]|nr:carbohydrate ABC transporter permease [Bifidobacteriaceae bacterium]